MAGFLAWLVEEDIFADAAFFCMMKGHTLTNLDQVRATLHTTRPKSDKCALKCAILGPCLRARIVNPILSFAFVAVACA
eukprot:976676-Pleurochrysis_carterae.AAC.1